MRSSAQIQVSAPPAPVQSVLPLFDGVELAQKLATDLTESRLAPATGLQVRTQRSSHDKTVHDKTVPGKTSPRKAAPGRDPLKQAQRVARQLRRGEIDASARQAAVNSLCQHLIDSLQSPPSRIHH